MKYKIGLLFIALVFVVGCGTASQSPTETTSHEPILYTNDDAAFTLLLPYDWQILSTSSIATVAATTRAPEGFEQQEGIENQQIVSYDMQMAIQMLDKETAKDRQSRCGLIVNNIAIGNQTFRRCVAQPEGVIYLSYYLEFEEGPTIFFGAFSRDGVYDATALQETTERVLSTLTFQQ